MISAPAILADDSTGKVVIFVIGLIVWGISSLVSMVKKANEAAKQKAARTYRPPAAPMKPPALPMAKRTMPAFAPRGGVRAMQQRRPAQAAPPRPSPPKLPPTPAALPAPMPMAMAQPPKSVTSATRATARAANAKALRLWLTPTTMRHQFILTELLQPPLSMRE